MALSAGQLFINGVIFIGGGTGLQGQPEFVESMFVQNGVIAALGPQRELCAKYQDDALTVTRDMRGRTILPGFIDGHMHLLQVGQSIQQLSLDHCQSLDEMIETLGLHAKANPELPRILARGWAVHLTPDGVHSSTLDLVDPRPIYITSVDLHSVWCNSAAIAELGAADMPDPDGGEIRRDEHGSPTGLVSESAVFSIVFPFLAQVLTNEQRMERMASAIEAYTASGYTGMIDMAMDEVAWDALTTLVSDRPDLPMRISAYWLMKPGPESSCCQQVDHAIELHREFNRANSPNLNVTGIKLVLDGTIDSCTAHLSEPYAVAPSPELFWPPSLLSKVVQQASAAGLQIAMHAIGDGAIRTAVDTLEAHTRPGSRHRIEHLELSAPEDAKRLGSLGITASIQPVHADPEVLVDWPRLLGAHRCSRAFAYQDMADSGALLAIGSDSPTAPWHPLRNLYVATTRKSARRPEGGLAAVNEHFRLGLCEAITAATEGAAKSVFAEHRVGTLEVGKVADFVVLDLEWDAEKLLDASVEETWFAGKRVYEKTVSAAE